MSVANGSLMHRVLAFGWFAGVGRPSALKDYLYNLIVAADEGPDHVKPIVHHERPD
ncbi:MAG: hypothetical protein AAGL90_15310 [Pseudomonadota bacterium]